MYLRKPLILLLVAALLLTGALVIGCGGDEETTTTSEETEATETTEASAESSESDEVYEISYAIFLPPAAAMAQRSIEFAEAIEERSDGRIAITIHEGGSLLGAPAVYEGVRDGIADMALGITSYSPGNFPFTSIAELPSAAESGWAVSNAMADFIEEYQPAEWDNVQLVTVCGSAGDMSAINTVDEPVTSLEDFKGKSIRFNHADIVTALGASMKDVPMSDVYDALSKGVLDGVIGDPEMLKSWKLGDAATNNTIAQNVASQPSIIWYNIMNKDTFEDLPSDLQQVVVDVGREFDGKYGLTWDNGAVQGIEYVYEAGNSVNVLSEEEAKRWEDAITPIIDERLDSLAKGNDEFTREQVDEAWAYFQDRVEYWNGEQSANDVRSRIDRMAEVMQ